MSFNGISAFVNNVDESAEIKIDELLELMVLAMTDVYEHNGVVGMNRLSLDEDEERIENYASMFNRICNGLTSSFATENEKLSRVRESLRSRAYASDAKLKELETEMEVYSNDIKTANNKLEALKDKERELENKKKELKETEKSCEKIEALVAEFSNETFEEKLAERRSKITAFVNAFESLKDEEALNTLFRSDDNEKGIEIGGNPVSNVDALSNWFEKMKETIDNLELAYEKAYLKVVELSEAAYKNESEDE